MWSVSVYILNVTTRKFNITIVTPAIFLLGRTALSIYMAHAFTSLGLYQMMQYFVTNFVHCTYSSMPHSCHLCAHMQFYFSK